MFSVTSGKTVLQSNSYVPREETKGLAQCYHLPVQHSTIIAILYPLSSLLCQLFTFVVINMSILQNSGQ
jgi:hypothetical protein